MKGNLPVTSLFIFFIIGQMIAYLLMSFNVMTIQSALEDYHQLSVSNERWHREPNWVTFKYNINAISGQGQERFNRQKMWYELGRDLIEKDKGLYIKNVSTQEYFEENLLDEKGKHSPMPDNLLFVSPNYLIEENIHIDNQLKDSFNQLKPGKYGLILPQKYKSSQKELIHKLKDRFRAYTREGYSSESRLAYEPQFQVSFIENDQRRFTFQSGMGKASKTPQFVEDPAIIILTPNNFGDTPATISSWAGELSRYLLLPSYEIFENRLEEYELKPYIANIENAQKTYFNNVNKYMQELIQTFLGTCLGVFTSFLLFNAMNILYFEHFRKENFIKRLDGQSFIQRHSSYLWVQLIALVSISIVSQLLGHSIWMSISVLLVFIINQWLSLMIQTRKENKISLTILKGK